MGKDKFRTIRDLANTVSEWPGWEVRVTNKGYQFVPPDRTKPIVTVHRTSDDYRAMKNVMADLRRSGGPV